MTAKSNIRVAIIGASSQIGRPLIARLTDAGYLSYLICRQDRSVDQITRTYVFEESTGELTRPLDFVDVVITLAPLPAIQFAIDIAQSLKAKRIIAFGSTGRFSKVDSSSAIDQEFVSQQTLGEKKFSTCCEENGIGWTLLRPTMIYGSDVDLNVSFIRSMIGMFGFFPIPIGANGLRQPVHADDLAGACVSVLRCEVSINKAYNLGGGEVLSFPQMVKKIFKAERKWPILIPVPKMLFLLFVDVLQKFPKSSFVRKEMVERMYQDLIADNVAAERDFGYSPRAFFMDY